MTDDECKILEAFRAMDDRRKKENLALMQQDAKLHPNKKPIKLRLIVNDHDRT
jgi:hypothetical protein